MDPGSIHVANIDELSLDAAGEVVVYCDCPNDASAAVVARRLKEKGFTRVRPLAGGFDAWRLEGRRVDRGEASPEGAFAQIGATRSKAAPSADVSGNFGILSFEVAVARRLQ